MGYAKLLSRAEQGLDAPLVSVEVHLAGGLPTFNIVGLAAAAVRESRDRVRGALATCQYDFPVSRIVVNLAPADIPKHGGRYDLAIALGILAASDQLQCNHLDRYEVFGELSLAGELCAVPGLLPACLHTYAAGRTALVAAANLEEAQLPDNAAAIAAATLPDIVQLLVHTDSQGRINAAAKSRDNSAAKFSRNNNEGSDNDDIAEIVTITAANDAAEGVASAMKHTAANEDAKCEASARGNVAAPDAAAADDIDVSAQRAREHAATNATTAGAAVASEHSAANGTKGHAVTESANSAANSTEVSAAITSQNAAANGREKFAGKTAIRDCQASTAEGPDRNVAKQSAECAAPAGGDIRDVHGHDHAKRALQIAATGGHNLLLSGPPGTGKSLLASRLAGLLPPMRGDEAMSTACIASLLGGGSSTAALHQRPFRSPHHSASAAALIGGGAHPRPGEISRAHNGVLFLDELPEFPRHVLEMLREPMETGVVHIARAQQQVTYPARFQLVAAMNSCPCGYIGDAEHQCRCSAEQVQRYQSRLSGPLIDRIDLAVVVPRVSFSTLQRLPDGPTSAELRGQVVRARARAMQRQQCTNAALGSTVLASWLNEGGPAIDLLGDAAKRFALSARHCHRLLRVARSIADLAESEAIEPAHMAEALSLRVILSGGA